MLPQMPPEASAHWHLPPSRFQTSRFTWGRDVITLPGLRGPLPVSRFHHMALSEPSPSLNFAATPSV